MVRKELRVGRARLSLVFDGNRPSGRRMGKKKRSGADEVATSSDDSPPPQCPHVKKTVDVQKLRKALRARAPATSCSPGCDAAPAWTCLACGAQHCDSHSRDHYEIPRSESHPLAVHVDDPQEVRCYACPRDLEPDSFPLPRLREAVEKLSAWARSEGGSASRDSPEVEARRAPIALGAAPSPPPPSPLEPRSPATAGRRVRGLTNLGNTCFFNSVMQCLAKTPYLLDVLSETSEPGEKFTLPGGKTSVRIVVPSEPEENGDERDDDDDVDDEEADNKEKEKRQERFVDKEIVLSSISGELDKWGPLTETLADALRELQSAHRCDVFTPKRLFNTFVNKATQFSGGDQHDSHELLRHLLEAVRSEDLRRYQSVILKKLGLETKEKRKGEIPDETKQTVKFYGNQASETILRPGQVFSGLLVSTLECQDCRHSSHTTEHFLDLSLPVTADKPQPPAVTRRKNQDEQAPENEKSKHQLKKEAQANRKMRKKKYGNSYSPLIKLDDNSQTNDTIENEAENKSSSEQSDADVEDNVDDMKPTDGSGYASQRDNISAYHMESGYNSEKVISSDSIRASPVDGDYKEKSDASPERSEKDAGAAFASGSQQSFEAFGGSENAQPSNPDSGVASPDTAKNILSDSINAESPVNNKESGIGGSPSGEMEGEALGPMILRDELPIANKESGIGASPSGEMDVDGERSNDSFGPGRSNSSLRPRLSNNSPVPSDEEISSIGNIEIGSSRMSSKTSYTDNFYSTFNQHPTFDIVPEFSDTTKNGDEPAADQNVPPRLSPESDSSKWKKEISLMTRGYNQTPQRSFSEEGEYSIQSCLNQFTSSELLTGNNKVSCEACTKRAGGKTVYTNATKRFCISSPPAVLILHLKRFQLGPRCILRKITKHVNFPLVLDLAPFCSEKTRSSTNHNKMLYSLYGVVEHSGSTLHLGHYVAYVKVRPEVTQGDSRWSFLPSNNKDVSGKTPEMVNGVCNNSNDDTDSSLSGYESGEGATGVSEVEPPPGKWYYISDSRVSETTEEKVLKVQAYLLFYERIL